MIFNNYAFADLKSAQAQRKSHKTIKKNIFELFAVIFFNLSGKTSFRVLIFDNDYNYY